MRRPVRRRFVSGLSPRPATFSLLRRTTFPPRPSRKDIAQPRAHPLTPPPISRVLTACINPNSLSATISSLVSQLPQVVNAFLRRRIWSLAQAQDVAKRTAMSDGLIGLGIERGWEFFCSFLRVVGIHGMEIDAARGVSGELYE